MSSLGQKIIIIESHASLSLDHSGVRRQDIKTRCGSVERALIGQPPPNSIMSFMIVPTLFEVDLGDRYAPIQSVGVNQWLLVASLNH